MTAPRRPPLHATWLARCLAVLVLCTATTGLYAADLGLITAGEHGTYYQFGQDLKRLLKPHGINVVVHPSNGAAQNTRALIERHGVQLGIVQSDVLMAITHEQQNLAMRAAAEGLRLVFPLYDEHVHIVALASINEFAELTGHVVAIGREGSGTYLTALALFQLAAVRPSAIIAMDGAQAIAQLRAGQIDAMVSVAGPPLRLLRDAVTSEDGFALVPVTAPAILDAYAATEIPAGTYPWQPRAVRTVAVTALLVVHDADRRHCATIRRVAEHVVKGLGWLVQNGHPYWKRVDLQRPIKGWEQDDCVQQYAGR